MIRLTIAALIALNSPLAAQWLHYPTPGLLRMTERYRRTDFGHIDLQVTLDDPKAYAKPWTVAVKMELVADTEMLEWFCENKKDSAHIATSTKGSDLNVAAEALAACADS